MRLAAGSLRSVVVLSALALLVSCNSAPAKTIVPPVDRTSFGSGLQLLEKAGLRARVDPFRTPLPDGIGLEEAWIGDQSPEPGNRVDRGSVVELTMGFTPTPSPVTPKHHPPSVMVPDLVGLPWLAAETKLEGLWPRIVSIAPLPPDKSERGLEAFFVASQSLEPGTRVPYLGVLIPHGLDPRPSTIELEIAID